MKNDPVMITAAGTPVADNPNAPTDDGNREAAAQGVSLDEVIGRAAS